MKTYVNQYLFLFVAAILAVSCATGKHQTDKSTDDQNNNNRPTLATEEQSDPATDVQNTSDSLFASISRGACYGKCPIYKMYIYNDGTVMLEGIRFMEPRGKLKSHVTKAQMQEFIDVANEIHYFDMKDKYDSPVTDIPSITTSITIDDKHKEVMRRTDFPQSILKFEKLFDNLLDTLDWELLEAPQD